MLTDFRLGTRGPGRSFLNSDLQITDKKNLQNNEMPTMYFPVLVGRKMILRVTLDLPASAPSSSELSMSHSPHFEFTSFTFI